MIITPGITIKGGTKFFPADPPLRTYYDMIQRLLLYYPSPLGKVNLPGSPGSIQAIVMSTDGTKFYTINDSEVVYEFDLSTPFDMNSISYNSVNTTLTELGGSGRALYISPNGTKLYAMSTSEIIHQYTLGTPWDLSTISYDSKSFNVSGYDSGGVHILVSNDGSKLYFVGDSSDTIYQFSLGTTFDISTATYDSVSLNVSTLFGETSPDACAFNSDGTKFYVYGSEKDDIFEFFLTTAWDISTAIFTGHSVDYDTIVSPTGLSIPTNNKYMYISQSGGDIMTVKLGEGNLFHFVNRTYTFTTNTSDTTYGVCVSRDGTMLFRMFGNFITKYVTPNAWVFSEFTLTNTYTVSNFTSNTSAGIRTLYFNDDGTKAYGFSTLPSTRCIEFVLENPYDFSNVISDYSVTFSGTGLNLGSMDFYGPAYITPDGYRIFIVLNDFQSGGRGYVIQQMYLSNAFELSSMQESSNVSLPAGVSGSDVISFFINDEGGRFYTVDKSNETIRSFYITNQENPWDITRYRSDSFYNFSDFETSIYEVNYQHYGNIIIAVGNFDTLYVIDLANNYVN
jgi:hypothetical protein